MDSSEALDKVLVVPRPSETAPLSLNLTECFAGMALMLVGYCGKLELSLDLLVPADLYPLFLAVLVEEPYAFGRRPRGMDILWQNGHSYHT